MIEIIPAIDLMNGKCVRLTHGDFSLKTVYSDDPLETARRFEAAGLNRLHVVDLDGARSGNPAHLATLAQIARGTNLTIDFGGGIKTDEDIDAAYSAGASIANVGSVAVKEPERFFGWVDKYGSDAILLGADAKNGNIAIDGWRTETETSVITMLSEYAGRGVKKAFVTDIGRDGAMAGPAVELYREIKSAVPQISLIASGGVRSVADIDELGHIGCEGVIIGKAIYEGSIGLEEVTKYAR